MTEPEAQKLVTVLTAAYPSLWTRLDEEQRIATMGTYRRMLVDLDYPAANAAIERMLTTSKYLPTVAEIREATLTVQVGKQKPGGEAWGEIRKLMSRYGARRYDEGWKAPIADPVAAHVVDLMGWINLCDSENQVADRAQFIKLYDQLAVQARTKQLSDALPAMQRYRAIEAKRTAALEQRTGETSGGAAFGKVLALVTDGES